MDEESEVMAEDECPDEESEVCEKATDEEDYDWVESEDPIERIQMPFYKRKEFIKKTPEEIKTYYKNAFQKSLDEKIRDATLDIERKKAIDEFKKEHAADYEKLDSLREERKQLFKTEEIENATKSKKDKYKWMNESDLNKLREKIKDLEKRQSEIIESFTDLETMESLPANINNMLIHEYHAIEDMKLVLLDKLIGNLRKTGTYGSGKYNFSDVSCGMTHRNPID